MKKIIALLALFFAFSVNATAQENATQIEKNAKKDLEALIGVVKLDSNMESAIYKLFIKKHDAMSAPNMTAERKSEISSIIETKLRASLNGEQTVALEKNRAIWTQLISAAPTASEKK